MQAYKIYSTRIQKVCAIVYAVDDDYIDDALLDVKPEDWEVIQSIEPEQIESYFGVSSQEYLEDTE